ncbi:peptidoglycan bridge formation glycyltransferase FemA/FemB family protein [Winogradskyella sp. PG-2]|uniref:peptidoglycan bridge formation glycyltransferase FemA/FemB family protein n=1 Tax=Winogradskyella sp. PG-2 TaxID=754409 RepID=UPI000458805F|nr:peptidoglycan bridge formation glycyltransferase FemA/FemB family protein [Winogradskyella sp. PG-2]BAO77485.1 hypothetical protein WPG_3255 [Winogradskyella sp. PG-2]
MIEVIKDKKDWNEQLALVEHFDFYHTYDYHHLSKTDDESPVLVKYTDNGTSLMIPLLIRSIENSDYKDATSVYGYAGVLALNIDEAFEKENFHKELNTFFKTEKIISVFSRLHPYFEEEEGFLEGLGSITTLGKVVYVDLSEPIDIQRQKYSRRLKTYVNKANKSCTVIKGNIEDHLETFIELYHENMKRVNADENYFFSNDYYKRILSSSDLNSELLLCKHNETEEIIAAAIFIKTGNIVQYHLSGLSENYMDLNPIKLIIDKERIKSTEEGYEFFNLGGGRGSEEDSLFKFKSSFSKSVKEFKIWKHIVSEDIYKTLSEKHLKAGIETNFFPAYRAKQTV